MESWRQQAISVLPATKKLTNQSRKMTLEGFGDAMLTDVDWNKVGQSLWKFLVIAINRYSEIRPTQITRELKNSKLFRDSYPFVKSSLLRR